MEKLLSYPLSVVYYFCFGLCLVIFHPIQWICLNVFGYQTHKKSVDYLNFFLVRCTNILGTTYTFKNRELIPENAPIITPINGNGSDDYYIAINDMVREKILTAHRITSPEIFGIMTPGKLGGKDEVTDAYLLFLNTVIRPYQQILLSEIENFLHLMYPTAGEFSVGVQQLRLFSDGETEVDVVTSVEAEAGEDKTLEAEIEQTDQQAENEAVTIL